MLLSPPAIYENGSKYLSHVARDIDGFRVWRTPHRSKKSSTGHF
jgi:hypothetical protein